MATISVKVQSAIVDSKGTAVITVVANDGQGEWVKIYKYNQTQTIPLADFKARVLSDLLADFGSKDQLAEITPLINKTFTLTV